jgi:predicted nucleic acid-binding protein
VIFVDTSVWIAALRRRDAREARGLDALLERDEVALPAPVRFEILSGASTSDRPRLRRLLSALPTYFPSEQTWPLLDQWLEAAAMAGERFGFADTLIAAVAAQHGGPIWSLDADFTRMSRLGFVSIHLPA